MKFLKYFFIFGATSFFLVQKVYAQTPTATPSAETPQTATSSASEEEKVKEIRDQLKEKVSEIKEKIDKKAFVGSITEITDLTLTLDNFRGKQRVKLNEKTQIINSSRKTIAAKDLAVEDKVIAMGTVSENDILEASRVVVVAKPTGSIVKRTVVMGTISSIDMPKSTVSIEPLKNEMAVTLKVLATTTLFLQSENKEIKLKDLEEDKKVIAIYQPSADGKTLTAKNISVLR
ncbi:MAG: hypothetical protein ACOX50_02980 [Patescibacteria group bacterium]|jgi:hypothetical protein